MNNFTQTEKKLQIGALRSIEIFNIERSILETKRDKQAVYEFQDTRNLFPNDSLVIIGIVGQGFPIITSSITGIIYALTEDDTNKSPIVIADNLDILLEIYLIIEKVWSGKENENSLKQTNENITLRNTALESIKRISPNADLSFWDWLAFRELSISIS